MALANAVTNVFIISDWDQIINNNNVTCLSEDDTNGSAGCVLIVCICENSYIHEIFLCIYMVPTYRLPFLDIGYANWLLMWHL